MSEVRKVRKHRSEDCHDKNDDDSVVSTLSIQRTHGCWGDDPLDVPWKGCVCGKIHARPTVVFWIQCEGPCSSWYNVSPKCVNGLTEDQAAHVSWSCKECVELTQQHQAPALGMLLDLPPGVLYRILEFSSKPTYRAASLQAQISSLCKASHHFVQGGKSKGVWEAILTREYTFQKQTVQNTSSKDPYASKQIGNPRSSKRHRKSTTFWNMSMSSAVQVEYNQSAHNCDPRDAVIRRHSHLISSTHDAYMCLEKMADPIRMRGDISSSPRSSSSRRPLSLQGLRGLTQSFRSLDVNRPSPFSGRTFLHVCCAAELNEASILRCVSYLLKEHAADPNVQSTKEHPYADRPVLFFAIARIMPKLVDTLIKAGASLTVEASGEFRRTFEPNEASISGSFTPLTYAQEIKRVESLSSFPNTSKGGTVNDGFSSLRCRSGSIPPYWMTKLNHRIRILEEATNLPSK